MNKAVRTGVGAIDVMRRVYRLGRKLHPAFTANNLKHRIKLLGIALVSLSDLRNWYDISDNPLLTLALTRFPAIHGAMYWPYINRNWPMKRRLASIDQHYRMLSGPATIIAHATLEEIELARFEERYAGLRLVLDKASWFLREGEIVLNLFLRDQRLYSIAFTLGVDAGQPIVMVGALQGSNTDAALGIYRDITHALHGMRPRDILMTALKLLCGELGIHMIWAIRNDDQQHNSSYFGDSHKDKMLTKYDEVWREHGGIACDNGFFEIPVVVEYKDMSNIPSRKRSTYRRRYEMLNMLALDIKRVCVQYSGQPL